MIYNWAKNTSEYIKSLDSNHMVTMGDEGFGPLSGGDGSYPYTTSAGGYTWADNLNITTLDFGTFHLYPDSCKFIRELQDKLLTTWQNAADTSNQGANPTAGVTCG